MSGFCPRCGSIVNDDERFCSKCGSQLNSEHDAYAPRVQTYADRRTYPDDYYAAQRPQEEYSYPKYAAQRPQEEYPYPDRAVSQPREQYAPYSAAKPKKKSKKGLVAGIIVGSVALIAAAAILLWSFVFNPDIAVKNAFQKQQEAGARGDHVTTFGYKYSAVFGGEGELEREIDQQIAFLEEYPQYKEIFANGSCTVLSIDSLPAKTVAAIKTTLQQRGYTDTEYIQDVRTLTYEYRNEKEEENYRYQLNTCLAIKVRGKWYFHYSDLSIDAPGKVSSDE